MLGTSQIPKEPPMQHHWQFLLQLEKSPHLHPRGKPLRTPAEEDIPRDKCRVRSITLWSDTDVVFSIA